MRMKNLLLASSALALLGATQEAQAGTYISVFGGANFLEDSSGFGASFFGYSTARFNTDADTGFVLGGAVGIHLDSWLQGLRAELEASYRRQNVGGQWGYSTFSGYNYSSGAIEANQSTFAIMANVWYDFDVNWRVKPYIGAGAGWARANFNGALLTFSGYNPFTQTNTSDNGFAWQAGFGFNYEIQPGVDLGVGYRYFEGPDVEISCSCIISNPEISNENHTVFVNLNIDIN